MNSVSWFIYIAQVSNSLGHLFVAAGVVGLGVVAVVQAVPRIHNSIECNGPTDSDWWKPPAFKVAHIVLAVASLVVGNLMPQRDTMYAIAASQVGEQIVKSEIASDATKALHQWIKKQIEPTK